MTKPSWIDRKKVDLQGLRVTLSEPVVVGRSHGYFWFANLWQMPSGDLLSTISPVADIHMSSIPYLVTWSRDGGLTWSAPIVSNDGGQTLLQLTSGDAILLPYNLRPRANGLGAPYNRIPAGTRTVEYVPSGVIVTGWPGPDKIVVPGLDMASFSFNGQTVTLNDGTYLATVYGELLDPPGYRIFTVKSSDGVNWTIHSLIADKDSSVPGAETGPTESAMIRLPDGRLMCVFRVGSRSPFGQSWSSDEGDTWTPAIAMAGPFSVQPSLAALPDGTLALSGGRPGIGLWLNSDGAGLDWQAIDLLAHHNACHPAEAITPSAEHNHQQQTSAYTEVIAVDTDHFLCMYDRIPNGWKPIPETMDETNSVWLVRVTVEKLAE
ncbi:MAG: sialidase family protein [Chloroflexi bacterium]|nr:sialidase family protein [Chloroflexota bacterium]